MSFADVVGHKSIVENIRRALAADRLANSYVFCGPEGVGKGFLARQLAKAIFCERHDGDACDHCRACRRVDSGTFPDFNYIAPEKRELTINAVRVVRHDSRISPYEGDRKLFVIDHADQMNAAAANCILKTLEEPPPRVIIVLLATTLAPLLPTIISRCQIVRFPAMPAEEVQRWLARNLSLDAGEAHFLARYSRGSIGKAIALHEENAYENRNWLIDQAKNLSEEDNFRFAGEITAMCRRGDKSREAVRSRIRTVLELLTTYYRDVLMRTAGCSQDVLFHGDRGDDAAHEARKYRQEQILSLIDTLFEAREHLDRNANVDLLMENLTHALAQIGVS